MREILDWPCRCLVAACLALALFGAGDAWAQAADGGSSAVETMEEGAEGVAAAVEGAAGAVIDEADSLAHTLAPYVAPIAEGGFGYLFKLLEAQPFLFIFLAMALGYPLGRIAIKGVSLGSTAGTLVVGLIISITAFTGFDIQFQLPGLVSTIFLSMFMYALGLKVGPSFFPGLMRGGVGLVIMGCIVITANFIICYGGAMLVGLDPGYAPGLISGSYTVTAVIGVATSAMQGGAWAPPDGMSTDQVSANIAAGYAISYVLATVGGILLIKYLPQLFGKDPVAEAKKAEAALGGGGDNAALPGSDAAFVMGASPMDIRAYRVEHDELVGQTVNQLFDKYPHAAVLRVVRGDQVIEAEDNPSLQKGDVIGVRGRYAGLIEKAGDIVGTEVDEPRARDVAIEVADVHVGKGAPGGRTVTDLAREIGFGLYLRAIFRQGHQQPVLPDARVEVGDVLRLAGPDWAVQKAAKTLRGKPITQSAFTEVMFLAVALVIGYCIGLLTLTLGGIPFALGTSAGCMLTAIGVATLRTWNPAFGGPVSEGARSFIQDIGLNVFIAVLAANVGSKVLASFQGTTVIWLAIIGLLGATVPPFLAFLYGNYVMKMNVVVNAGACAGGRNSTPALNGLLDSSKSAIGATAYPVTYALTSAMVLISGYLAMILS